MSDQSENLEFFRVAIVNRLNQPVVQSRPTILSDFAFVETADWACLGAQIGYFDANEAYRLVSEYRAAILNAWRRLAKQQASRNFIWHGPIRRAPTKELFLDKKPFSELPSEGSRDLAFKAFQNSLLLVTENILVDDSEYFLDLVGWTTDEEWFEHTKGPYALGRSLAAGFANVLQYLDEVILASYAPPSVSVSESDWKVVQSMFNALEHSHPTTLSRSQLWMYSIWSIRSIIWPRFNLELPEVQKRYFVLAGEFANLANDGSPEWFEGQRTAFYQVSSAIRVAQLKDYWTVFSRSRYESARGTREDTSG